MKSKILTLIILVFFSCDKKHNFNNALNIKIKYCQNENSHALLGQFKLYYNDSLLETISPRAKTKITIDSLKKGNYRIDYRTLFYEDTSINVYINGFKKIYEVDLCIDYFDHKSSSFTSIVDSLNDNDEYTLKFVSHGCEHFKSERMKVSRVANDYIIKIDEKEKRLNKSNLTSLRRFEIELMNIDSASGCTTTDYYTINHKGREIKITDGGCRWKGFRKLKKSLGFIKKKQ